MNDGAIVHDITFEGGTAQVADPGEMIAFEVTIPDGGRRSCALFPGTPMAE